MLKNLTNENTEYGDKRPSYYKGMSPLHLFDALLTESENPSIPRFIFFMGYKDESLSWEHKALNGEWVNFSQSIYYLKNDNYQEFLIEKLFKAFHRQPADFLLKNIIVLVKAGQGMKGWLLFCLKIAMQCIRHPKSFCFFYGGHDLSDEYYPKTKSI